MLNPPKTNKTTFEKIRALERTIIKIGKEYGWKLIKRARSSRSEATYLDLERSENDPRCVDKNLGDSLSIRIATHPPYHERSFAEVNLNPYFPPTEDALHQAFSTNNFSFNQDGSLFIRQRKETKNNPSKWPVMSYKQAHAYEPLAKARNVSMVARSGRGFMRAYQKAGSWNNLSPAWKNKRNNFVSRHMAQVKNNGEQLWKNGKPSRRALALIMWGYMPPGKKLKRNPLYRVGKYLLKTKEKPDRANAVKYFRPGEDRPWKGRKPHWGPEFDPIFVISDRQLRNPGGKSYLDRLIKEFGVTESAHSGFWMLPDGNFLDGSSGSGMRRYEDHRIITHVKPPKDIHAFGERDTRMRAVAATAKLIRWMPETWKAELMTKPTRAQLRTLGDLIRERRLELYFRISPTRELQRTYEPYEADDAVDELRRMFGV